MRREAPIREEMDKFMVDENQSSSYKTINESIITEEEANDDSANYNYN